MRIDVESLGLVIVVSDETVCDLVCEFKKILELLSTFAFPETVKVPPSGSAGPGLTTLTDDENILYNRRLLQEENRVGS